MRAPERHATRYIWSVQARFSIIPTGAQVNFFLHSWLFRKRNVPANALSPGTSPYGERFCFRVLFVFYFKITVQEMLMFAFPGGGWVFFFLSTILRPGLDSSRKSPDLNIFLPSAIKTGCRGIRTCVFSGVWAQILEIRVQIWKEHPQVYRSP